MARRTVEQIKRDGYFEGYQAAMADIATVWQGGGEDAVREWVRNNATGADTQATVKASGI